jgi:hypothetical protein
LYFLATGAANSAFGNQALNAATGSNNSAFGNDSLASLETGSDNTAIGNGAGYNGSVSLTSLSGCTFLGRAANASVNALTNSTAIGNGAQVTASNQVAIGNTSVTEVKTAGAYACGTFFRSTPQSVTTNATITSGRVKFTGSTAAQTLTLPAGIAGTDCFIRNAGSVAVTIARAGSDTIEGATTFVLEPGEAISLCFVTSDWTVF